MNANINKLLNEGEGISVEFKKAYSELPSNFFETVCAFLNRNGGSIILGVSDDRKIEGVNPNAADSLCKNIANLSNNPQKLFPSFLIEPEVFTHNGKTLIHVFVPISSQVHRCNGRVYDRSADGDFELKTDAQIKNHIHAKTCFIVKIQFILFYTKPILFRELLNVLEKL
ncbi:MAG: ATP-binding protein [Bacteroidales bacterium]|nr:ATP-binding protein [Bacteroidales bacterium]